MQVSNSSEAQQRGKRGGGGGRACSTTNRQLAPLSSTQQADLQETQQQGKLAKGAGSNRAVWIQSHAYAVEAAALVRVEVVERVLELSELLVRQLRLLLGDEAEAVLAHAQTEPASVKTLSEHGRVSGASAEHQRGAQNVSEGSQRRTQLNGNHEAPIRGSSSLLLDALQRLKRLVQVVGAQALRRSVRLAVVHLCVAESGGEQPVREPREQQAGQQGRLQAVTHRESNYELDSAANATPPVLEPCFVSPALAEAEASHGKP